MTTLTILPTMTVQEVCDAFAATWPGLQIEFFSAETAFYKDSISEPYLLEPEQKIGAIGLSADSPVLTIEGNMNFTAVRLTIYRPYYVEVEVHGIQRLETLDAAVLRLSSGA